VDDRLSIGIPGTLHNLVADSGQLNAPVVLSPVSGEFIALVKVVGRVEPGPESSVADSLPYNGTGLLIWVDRDNYIRLERAGIMRDGAFVTYANLEHFSRGRRSFSQGTVLQDLPTYLRLERRGKSVYASLSQDGGVNWSSFPKLEVPLPDELKLGVAAVNSSTKPFTADLTEFRIFARKEVQGR
jgi:regulation of enolase protein 1 (concanavalin A-like superfamily)